MEDTATAHSSTVYRVGLWGKMNQLIFGWLSLNHSCYISVKMISRQLKMCTVLVDFYNTLILFKKMITSGIGIKF